ncbi:MAG TPA: serine hydrolase domain-containing protein [Candidatus Paceibacterota bacterium]|nr:serine hydrolase domain-containing protein [Verrucomicrobiota bacterium]HSA10962.1 serine hydrolase domain-containing protein [Candidatus Paceibacterota bacterium]
MTSVLSFIPLVIGLLGAFVGLAGAVLAAIGLRRARAARSGAEAQTAKPPVLSDAVPPTAGSNRVWTLFLRCLLALGLGVLAAGLLGAWSTKPSLGYQRGPVAEWSDGHAPELEPLIRKHCASFISRGKSIGLAAAVVTPSGATIMTFGRPSLSADARTSADTLFELGSITKTFTGLTLARQIEHGNVRLDQPIRELLPPGADLPEEAREVTLRHLTSHSSGFPRMPDDWSPVSSLGMLVFGSDPYAGYRAADLLADVRSVRLQSAPGTKACYSNFGMALLGYLLATNASSRYETLVKREVCLPLGLGDTTVTLNSVQAQRSAQGYRAVLRLGPIILALRSAPWFAGNDLGGAGALRSTATDMLKYLQANMHPEGQPLEHAIQESHRVLFEEDARTAFGMNWIHLQSQRLGRTIIWHNGGTGGFRSFIGFTADRRLGVVLLSNSGEDVDDLAVNLLRDLDKPPGRQDRPAKQTPAPLRAGLTARDQS